jgi:hypothetical protein
MRNISVPLLQSVSILVLDLDASVNASFPSLILVRTQLELVGANSYDLPVLSNILGTMSIEKTYQNFPALVNIGKVSLSSEISGLGNSFIDLPILKTIQASTITIRSISVFSAPLLESTYGMTFASSVNNISVPMLRNVTGTLSISSTGVSFSGDFLSLQRVTGLSVEISDVTYVMSTPSLVDVLGSVNIDRDWQAPMLLRIGGGATVPTSLVAPLLTTIGGSLTFTAAGAINLPSLQSVHNVALAGQTSINLPSLITVMTLTIGGPTSNTTLPKLTSVGENLNIEALSMGQLVDLPKLSRVFSLVLQSAPPSSNVSMPMLKDASTVTIGSSTSALPIIVLENVQQITITCIACTTITLAQLSVVTDSISINVGLVGSSFVTLNLGSLTYVGGDVTISGCTGTAVATSMLQALAAIPDYGQYRTVSITCLLQNCDADILFCLPAKNTLIARGATVNVPNNP